jgi:hypothetical protein
MSARPVKPGFSPLDEALGLGGSAYSPGVLRRLVHLGADLPFARAAARLEELTGVVVSAATVRRQTEAVGASAVALNEAEVSRLACETPTAPAAPARLVLGADGSMVPLVGGDWAEVKLVSVGEPEAVAAGVAAAGVAAAPARVETGALSYFAQLADAETFGCQALGELHRRGLERAGAVAAVQDGAPWLQGFVDYHRADALRILDWAHAVEHLSALAARVFGEQTPRSRRALARLKHWLWTQGPTRVLGVLAGWERAHPELASAVAYFRTRAAQLDYPTFRAQGWPVGSGATESAHDPVMQARMKRAGMRWARAHVNPLLALRLLDVNRRWAAECPALLQQHAHCGRTRRQQRAHTRRAARGLLVAARPSPSAAARPAPARPPLAPRPSPPPSPFRHPWRRYGAPLSVKI